MYFLEELILINILVSVVNDYSLDRTLLPLTILKLSVLKLMLRPDCGKCKRLVI